MKISFPLFFIIVNNFCQRQFNFCKQKKRRENYLISKWKCKIFIVEKFLCDVTRLIWNIFTWKLLEFQRFQERYTYMGQKMYTCVALTVVALVSTMHFGVEAWGGLFNRFSPEMLSNLGYGSHGDHIGKSGLYQVWTKFFINQPSFLQCRDIFTHQIKLFCNFAAVLPVYDRYIIFIELCAFHVRIYLNNDRISGEISLNFHWNQLLILVLNWKNCFKYLISNVQIKKIYMLSIISSIFYFT